MKYGHYLKECKFEKIDIYRILEMYNVTSPAIQHSVKKLLVAGGRGAKDAKKDVEEAIDSLVRWLEMRREEEAQPESPRLQAGDQIAWNHGDGWQYVALKESDLPNMQGNDLKVSICDTMNLADSFLKTTQQELRDWGRELKPVKVIMQYSLDGVTWHDSKDGSYNVGNATTFQARIHPEDDLRWGEHHEARMDVIGQNGPTGEHYIDKVTREMMQEQDKAGIYDAHKQDDGWVTHDGGHCPVHPDTLVDATFHGGAYSIRPLIAGGLQWNNTYSNYTVDRYRIVQDMSHEDEEAQV